MVTVTMQTGSDGVVHTKIESTQEETFDSIAQGIDRCLAELRWQLLNRPRGNVSASGVTVQTSHRPDRGE
jgi:hypothetical protein